MQVPCPALHSSQFPLPSPPGEGSSQVIVEIEVGRYALEVQAVGGRVSAPESPARPGAEVPPEVLSEQLLAVAAVGEARVAGGRRPCGRRRRPPHAGVLPEVGHEQEEEGQGGEDDVRAHEERGGGHRGFRFFCSMWMDGRGGDDGVGVGRTDN